MHGPHSVSDSGTVIHCEAEVCRWLNNEKLKKTDIRLTG